MFSNVFSFHLSTFMYNTTESEALIKIELRRASLTFDLNTSVSSIDIKWLS